MTNIFNLFLFLFFLWSLFMIGSSKISLFYVIWGIISSALVASASFKLKLIKKDSEFLYLSFGFYCHFIKIILSELINSIKLIVNLAFSDKNPKPQLYNIDLKDSLIANKALIISSINMSAGLLFLHLKKEEISIYAIDKRYFEEFKIKKIITNINKTNDENLI